MRLSQQWTRQPLIDGVVLVTSLVFMNLSMDCYYISEV